MKHNGYEESIMSKEHFYSPIAVITKHLNERNRTAYIATILQAESGKNFDGSNVL